MAIIVSSNKYFLRKLGKGACLWTPSRKLFPTYFNFTSYFQTYRQTRLKSRRMCCITITASAQNYNDRCSRRTKSEVYSISICTSDVSYFKWRPSKILIYPNKLETKFLSPGEKNLQIPQSPYVHDAKWQSTLRTKGNKLLIGWDVAL